MDGLDSYSVLFSLEDINSSIFNNFDNKSSSQWLLENTSQIQLIEILNDSLLIFNILSSSNFSFSPSSSDFAVVVKTIRMFTNKSYF